MHDSGMTYSAIGQALGVSHTTAIRWLNPIAQAKNRTASASYRAANKKIVKARKAAYYASHKDGARVQSRSWKRAHSDKVNAYEAKRRALKQGALIGATVSQLAEIAEIYRKAKEDRRVRCYLCGKLIPKGHRHVDHIIPLSKGGAHRSSNLAVACDDCNESKGPKNPEEFGLLL